MYTQLFTGIKENKNSRNERKQDLQNKKNNTRRINFYRSNKI